MNDWDTMLQEYLVSHDEAAGGYFTVEAALLMGLILPMLWLIILTGFLIHDRAYMQGIACEGTALAGAMHWHEEGEKEAEKVLENRSKKAMTWSKDAKASQKTSGKIARHQAYCEVSGTFQRFAALPFMDAETLTLAESWEKTIYEPADLIRIVRGAQKLLQTEK